MRKEELIAELHRLAPADRQEVLAQFVDTAGGGKAPQVFLSYSRTDIPFVHELMTGLERGGVHVWFDVRKLTAGEDYLVATEKGLRECDYCLVVVSYPSMTSVEVLRELTIARTVGTRILPVILQDYELAEPLRNLQWSDFRFHFDGPLTALIAQLHGRSDESLIAERLHAATKPLNTSRAVFQRFRKGTPASVRWFNFLLFTSGVLLFYPGIPFLHNGTWAGAGFIITSAVLIIYTSLQIADRQHTHGAVRSSLWSMLFGVPAFSALFCILLPLRSRWLVVWTGLTWLILLVAALLISELSPSFRRWLPARPEQKEFLPSWWPFTKPKPVSSVPS